MGIGLTESAFGRLLDHLDGDRERAAGRYEELRRVLLRFFEWRGAPFPEEHTDVTFDRVARKLAEGVAVENVARYSYGVARLVLLEALKGPDRKREQMDLHPRMPASEPPPESAAKEARLACLDDCLQGLPAESRDMILAYYMDDKRGRIEGRRRLAERLGLRAEALANRAQRLRDKLERCVTTCVGRTAT